jgi:hypothetical protein
MFVAYVSYNYVYRAGYKFFFVGVKINLFHSGTGHEGPEGDKGITLLFL